MQDALRKVWTGREGGHDLSSRQARTTLTPPGQEKKAYITQRFDIHSEHNAFRPWTSPVALLDVLVGLATPGYASGCMNEPKLMLPIKYCREHCGMTVIGTSNTKHRAALGEDLGGKSGGVYTRRPISAHSPAEDPCRRRLARSPPRRRGQGLRRSPR
jgi:hypothetical protein